MSSISRSLTTMLLAAALCGPLPAEDPPRFTPGPADSKSKAISDARLFAVVKHFERAVNNRDADAINAAFDVDTLLDRVCDGLAVTASQRRTFARNVGLTRAAEPYLEAVGESGHIKVLRIHEIDGGSRALYRLVGDDGLNYHDAVLARNGDGHVAIIDAYVFATGEMMSVALRRILVRHLDLDRTVPPRAPDHVGVDLIALERLMAGRKWDAAIETVGRIEKAVGDDAYLDTLRAFFLCEQGTYDRAVELADLSIDREPMLEEARLIRLRIALAQRDFDSVAASLTVLERDFGWPLEEIAKAPAYGLFVRSPAYKRWLAERKTALAE